MRSTDVRARCAPRLSWHRAHWTAAAVLVLALSGSAVSGCDPVEETADSSVSGARPTGDGMADRSAAPSTVSGAARYLPDFSGQPFAVHDTDLAALVDPVQQAVSLVKDALRDPERRIPRRSVAGAGWTKPVKAFEGEVAIAATAVTCLHQQGHLELHSYTNAKYPYSLAVVFVLDAKALTDAGVAWCALESSIPTGRSSLRNSSSWPVIDPCVGARTAGSALVAWLATTQEMCQALKGTRVDPQRRPLRQQDSGTDVAQLQAALNDVQSHPSLTIDGDFGRATAQALRTFQACYPVSGAKRGIADQKTRQALQDAADAGRSVDGCTA